jgi:hypothetical protein
MYILWDPLTAERAHNLSWPAFVTNGIFDEITEIYNWASNRTYLTLEMRRMAIGRLIDTVRCRRL